MPHQVVWDDEGKTIIRQIYKGHTKLEDYISATDEFGRMARSVNHTVHSILDRTQVISTPAVLIPALRYANSSLPPNLGMRVIVKGSLFTRMLVDIGKKVATKLVTTVYFVDTIEQVHTLIAKHSNASTQ